MGVNLLYFLFSGKKITMITMVALSYLYSPVRLLKPLLSFSVFWLPFFSMTTPSTRCVYGERKVGKAFPPLWDTDLAFLNCG
jgi:hypothetical protein